MNALAEAGSLTLETGRYAGRSLGELAIVEGERGRRYLDWLSQRHADDSIREAADLVLFWSSAQDGSLIDEITAYLAEHAGRAP